MLKQNVKMLAAAWLGNARLIRDQRYRAEPWCRNADAGLRQLTPGRNADSGLTFLWHSGIYIWYIYSYIYIWYCSSTSRGSEWQSITLFEWLFAYSVRLQCRRSRVRFPTEKLQSSDALCRGCRWPWSSPYIVVTPTWCNSHAVLRFVRPAPSHAIDVRAPCSLSCYSDLHASDQIYPRPSQTQPRSPIKSLRHRGSGGAVVVQAEVPNGSQ